MSVIFETLQKLNRASAESETDAAASRPRRNAHAFKSVLMSPVTVILLALLVFGLGYGLVYGLRLVQSSAQMDPAVLAAAGTPAAEAASGDTAPAAVPVAVPQEIPPPPDVRHLETMAEYSPVEAPTSASGEMPAAPVETVAAASNAGAYTPPEQGWAAALDGAPPSTVYTQDAAAAQWQSNKGSHTPEFYPAMDPPISSVHGAAFSQVNPANGGGEMGTLPPDDNATGILPHQRRSATPHTENRAGLSAAAFPTTRAEAETYKLVASVAPQETMSMEAMSAPQDQALDPPPSFRRSPIPRYTRLVQRLQTAVIGGDAQTTDRLLDEFATVKGQGHPYLAKIKAYRLLLAGEYGAAEPLLMQVLAQDETDRDAQMNMAVVEANTGRQDSARRRVARLVARFPEDETIAAMGRQLN